MTLKAWALGPQEASLRKLLDKGHVPCMQIPSECVTCWSYLYTNSMLQGCYTNGKLRHTEVKYLPKVT